MEIIKDKIKSILVVRNDRFGEFLLNIPAMRALKEIFAKARIIAVVSSYVKELAERIPYIDELILWDRKKCSLFEKLRLVRFLKKKNMDISIILNPSRDFNLIAFLSSIPIRVGYDRKWGFLLTHKMQDKKHLSLKHEVEYNLDLVGLIGAKTEDKSLFLSLADSKGDELGQFNIGALENLIAVHPWTSDPIKQWPTTNFSILIKKLLKLPNYKVILIGGKENLNHSNKLFSAEGSSLIDLTGKTTLVELAVILERSKLLISGDSGPVHLATCVGTPVLAIFRNDLPGKSAKRWGPWGGGNVVLEKPNLDDMTVEEVLIAVNKLLGIKFNSSSGV